jgi:hypothetical protein
MLKFLITSLAFSAIAPSFADTATTFGDLLYMPNSSEYLFDNKTVMTYADYNINRANTSGGPTVDVYQNQRRLSKMDQKLNYSINDYMQFGVGLGFAFIDHNYNDVKSGPNGEARTKEPMVKNSASFTDPSLSFRYRLMNTKDDGMVLDLTANALVDLDWVTYNGKNDLYRAKRGAVTVQNNATVGNQKRGGSQYAIGTEVGKNFGVFEGLVYGQYILGMKAKTQRQQVDPNATSNTDPQAKTTGLGDVDYNQDSTHEFNLGVKTLTHLYTRWLLGVGADIYMHDETTNGGVWANGDRLQEVTESYVTTTVNAELRFIYTRDLFMSLGGIYGMNSDRVMTTTKNGNIQTIDSYVDDNMIMGGSFQLVAKF